MFDLKKLLSLGRPPAGSLRDADSDYPSSVAAGEGLEIEYHHLVTQQFRRWRIEPKFVTVHIRKLGQAPDGFDVFVAMVRLTQWDRGSALRLFVGLPLLEAKVRKAIRGTWLADVSHFAGLWVHASEGVHLGADADEVRELLTTLKLPVPDSGPSESMPQSEPAPH